MPPPHACCGHLTCSQVPGWFVVSQLDTGHCAGPMLTRALQNTRLVQRCTIPGMVAKWGIQPMRLGI